MNYINLKTTFILTIAFLLQLSNVQAQNKRMEKAEDAYKKFAFIEAAKLYKEEIKNGNKSLELYTKLGNCYYYNGNYSEAANYYSQIIDSPTGLDPEYYFRYAQCLNNNQDYKNAESVMKVYYNKLGKSEQSENWNEKKLFAAIEKQSGRCTINNVAINTPFSDFGSAIYDKNKVVFASARDTGVIIKRKHSWNEKSFLKLYTADISVDGGLENAKLLKGDVNTRYHQSSAVVTKDGKKMYFTRNNYFEGKLGADKKGTTFLKIYEAENVNGEWKNIKELPYPINSNGYSSGHPALNPDETEMYFSSDRDNTFGNSDLYVVNLKKGNFVKTEVRKLGDEINTPGRETYPFVDGDGVLYFSSDGHPGLGGLDVFAAIKDEKGIYHVVNMGQEINSSADDFAYVFMHDTKKGFFSSDRSGNDDIYGFIENKPVSFDFNAKPVVSGLVRYYNSKEPIEGMQVEVYDVENKKLNTLYSDKNGRYSTSLDPYHAYKLFYKKTGLTQQDQIVPELKPLEKADYINEFIDESHVIVDNKEVEVKTDMDLTHVLNLNPIYFDYNGYKIRESSKAELDKIVKFMKERPNLTIKVNSHTDSRGRDDFNMKLSQNRANATVDYIVNNGIKEDRITGQGYGETRLLNKCKNGVPCTEAEHQLNRRSEFIVHLFK